MTASTPPAAQKGCLCPPGSSACGEHPETVWARCHCGAMAAETPLATTETPAADALVAGLDGCRAGWVVATISAGACPRPRFEVRVIDRLEAIVDHLTSGRLRAAGIDMPIGLPATGPPRATSQRGACSDPGAVPSSRRRRARCSLRPRLRRGVCALEGGERQGDLEAVVQHPPEDPRGGPRARATPGLQACLVEMCPELSFAVLAGAPMAHAKRSAEGRAERLAALRPLFGEARPPRRARGAPADRRAPDDVLDAIVGAWTARRYEGARISSSVASRRAGLRMEVIA